MIKGIFFLNETEGWVVGWPGIVFHTDRWWIDVETTEQQQLQRTLRRLLHRSTYRLGGRTIR